MARIDEILKLVRRADATDLHLASGSTPIIRKMGQLEKTSHKPLTEKQVRGLLYEIIGDEQIRQFEKEGDLDCSYGVDGIGRFRINLFKRYGGIGAAIRLISDHILTIEELGLKKEVENIIATYSGLALVTGPTNSGKSTTLAAIVDHINRNTCKHIITLEDPIEFVHESKLSLVTQRQVGEHTGSFGRALRGALREDPDVILVGEMRDAETIGLAMTAAEVGLLVLGTLHTNSATQTVERILDAFPADEQILTRVILAETLRGVISQKLVRRQDGRGRELAHEVLIRTTAIAAMIRDGKTHQIPGVIQTGSKVGMHMLDDHLKKLVDSSVISVDEAIRSANDPARFFDQRQVNQRQALAVGS